MKKSSTESKDLPRFQTDIPGLQSLVQSLKDYFGQRELRVVWTVVVGKTEYQVENIDEIKSLPEIDSRLYNVRLWVSDSKLLDGAHCSLRFGDSLTGLPRCSVDGQNLPWCVGAVSIFTSFAQKRRVWFSWLRRWHFLLLTIGLWMLPKASKSVNAHETSIVEYGILGICWILLMLTMTIWWDRLVPSAVVIIRPEASFLRRNKTELTLIVALIAALAAVGKLFVK